MQSRQGMNKGMQGMRKNVNVYTIYGFLTTSKPVTFFYRIAPQHWYARLCVYVPASEAINN